MPPPRGIRGVERWLVGIVMAMLAFAIEKTVLRSIRKGDTKPLPSQPTPLTATGADVSADRSGVPPEQVDDQRKRQ